jgi:hypothetical protein
MQIFKNRQAAARGLAVFAVSPFFKGAHHERA